jgi:hypothetical protein
MGGDQVKISVTIKPTWTLIKEIQSQAEKFMKDHGKNQDIIDATIMCVTELIENAVKYGADKPDGSNIDFNLSAFDDTISIVVTNGYHNESDLKNVIENIDRIKASNDPSALYVERLQQLMENPRPGVSQLGLYRIAYEGEFLLDYKCGNGSLTVIAQRKI